MTERTPNDPDPTQVAARHLADEARPELSRMGFDDRRIEELAVMFAGRHADEGHEEFVHWAKAEGPVGLDPNLGL